ncbi:MAG: uL22 family ribosomal protein, partial [Pseudomonadota bacterium]
MGKPARERTLADNEARSFSKLMRTSPQKLNLVAQMIRGKSADRALADLTFSKRRIAGEV